MNDTDFDLIVIGAGSGGMACASRAAERGARVALIERGELGGTCVNVGCVPKKAMWCAAEVAETLRAAAGYGFRLPGAPLLDWPALIAARQAYIERIHAGYQARIQRLGIRLFQAHGRLLGNGRVQAGEQVLRGRYILIATGGRSLWPELPGSALGIDSDGFFALEMQPRRVALAGAGYIAVELAGVLNALGSEVELYIRGQQVLRRFDTELAQAVTDNLVEAGVRLHRGSRILGLSRGADGAVRPRLEQAEGAAVDAFVWAIGRGPNTEGLGLEAAGIAVDEGGRIRVDAAEQTSAPGVYAIGDVTGRVELTPVAVAAGRLLAERLFNGGTTLMDYANVPSVVFSHPPLATVGLGEAEARARHGDGAVKVYTSRFRPLVYAVPQHGPRTLVKLVCVGEAERVVGVHLVGHGADEILQGFAVALKMGATKADFDRTVAIHPSSAEELVTLR